MAPPTTVYVDDVYRFTMKVGARQEIYIFFKSIAILMNMSAGKYE